MMNLERTATCDDTSLFPCVRVTNLPAFIESMFKAVPGEMFSDEIWLLFGADKGVSHMKFHFEIINSTIAGSVDNVHIDCMYEASDIIENMWKVHDYCNAAIHEVQNMEIDCRKVRVFPGGYLHFLEDICWVAKDPLNHSQALQILSLLHIYEITVGSHTIVTIAKLKCARKKLTHDHTTRFM